METKKWWLSKTVWAGVILVVGGLLELAKLTLLPGVEAPAIAVTILGVLTVVFRAVADTKLSG